MTEEELQQIRERVEKATSGPWEMRYSGKPYIASSAGIEVGECDASEDDSEFIVHARADIPTLLAEVERLQSLEDVTHVSSRIMRLTDERAAAVVRVHRLEELLRDFAELDPAEIADYDLVRRARALLAKSE